MKPFKWLWILLIMFGCQAQPQPMPPETPTPSISLPKQTASPQPIESPYLNPKVEIVAGTGEQGFQDGLAAQATFNRLGGLCHDPNSGELYILDTHKVRKLGLDGRTTTVAGQNESGFRDGSSSQSLLSNPADCVVDQQSQVYIADASNRRIRLLRPNGEIETVAGTGQSTPVTDGPALVANLLPLDTLALNSNGVLYFSDSFHLRKLEKGQVITLNKAQSTIAHKEHGYQNGLIQQATFGGHLYLAFDEADTLYISDQQQQVLRKMDTEGNVSDVIGRAARDIDPSLGLPFFVDTLKNVSGILLSDSTGLYLAEENRLTLITSPKSSDLGKLPFGLPFGLSVSPKQWIYISDRKTNQIKRFRLNEAQSLRK